MAHKWMAVRTRGCALLLCSFILLAGTVTAQESLTDSSLSCPTEISIPGGTVVLSDGYHQGSILVYSCPDGTYPYPVRSRICESDGNWTPMRSPSGKPVTRALCRDVRCPPQRAFENGFFSPRQNAYPVGGILNFECFDGYQLHGSAQRHCQPNGRWNGTTPVCDDGVGHCPSLAIPPGALATGVHNRLGSRVTFQCMQGLNLIGSPQRVCTPEGEWSGAVTSCRAPYSYDRAEDVAAEFGASLTNVLSVVSSDLSEVPHVQSLGRKLILSQDSFLHVYLLADASHSVTKANFKIFKKSFEIIIHRIASFEVPIRFAVLSYASKPKTIVQTFDDIAEDPDLVIEKMEQDMKYEDHGNATGTNIQEALKAVYIMMINHRVKDKHWDATRHAIILLTDGKSNMGGSPKNAVRSIEDLLGVNENRNDYLDIYVFGVGNLDVDLDAMNEVASKKAGERHVFTVKDPQELKKAFEDILDPRDLQDLCGMANNSASATRDQNQPWHVTLQENTQKEATCRGALISRTWVLTAAHCFSKFNHTPSWNVILDNGPKSSGTMLRIKRRIDHELYNVHAKVDQGIKEFYDYDLSLLELEIPEHSAAKIRPICLPCTTGANKALKKPETATCKDHELDLLSFEKVPAQFISLDNERKNVLIKRKKTRPTCISAAVQHELYSKVANVSEVVTDRFLCSGDDKSGAVEDATCKGESGGSLFVERRARYFQVGVISWGIFDPCEKKRKVGEHIIRETPKRGQKARDFYISLFRVQDWLRHHLAGFLRFIPQQ